MSNLMNFQVSYQANQSPNFGKILVKDLKLPDTSNGFGLLTKIWKSSGKFLSKSHNLEVVDVFREKRVEGGYECVFTIKHSSIQDLGTHGREDFIREQIWQFGRILRIFLSSESYERYCDYLANNQPNPLVCNRMLDDFLKEAGFAA